jgi:hypothetical protein
MLRPVDLVVLLSLVDPAVPEDQYCLEHLVDLADPVVPAVPEDQYCLEHLVDLEDLVDPAVPEDQYCLEHLVDLEDLQHLADLVDHQLDQMVQLDLVDHHDLPIQQQQK